MGEPVSSAPTPGILSWDEFRSFWISWREGGVQVKQISLDYLHFACVINGHIIDLTKDWIIFLSVCVLYLFVFDCINY